MIGVLREVYDFITGGSIAAPVGLIVACAFVVFTPGLGAFAHVCVFVAVLLLTLFAAANERVR